MCVCECMCVSVPVPVEVGYWGGVGGGGGSLQWRVEIVPNKKVYTGKHNSSPPPHFPRLKKVIAATPLRSMAPDPCLIIHTLIQYNNNHKITNKQKCINEKESRHTSQPSDILCSPKLQRLSLTKKKFKLKEQIRQSHVTSEVSLLTEEG